MTILFSDLRGSTSLIERLDPEAALFRLEPALKIMSDAVLRFGGIVARFQGDGVMALFGVPNATEDHATSACLAARAIIDDIAALNEQQISSRIGIASGEVVVRSTGRDDSDYDVAGVAANLAARLEQAADPGSILISPETAWLARGAINAAQVEPVFLKGLSQPVKAVRLLAATVRPSWEMRASASKLTPFVGREQEKSDLKATLRELQRGRGCAVAVVGEAGIGKSRLVHEFLSSLPAGWRVMRAAAAPSYRSAPYQVVAEILHNWIGGGLPAASEGLSRRLQAAISAHGEKLSGDAAALRVLLDVESTDADWEDLEPVQKSDRMVSAFENVLFAEAQRSPLIVIVEDFQSADAYSVAALDSLADGIYQTPLLLLITTRPERRPRWANVPHSEVFLEPLPLATAELLLENILGTAQALGPLRWRIATRAEGTPLFLEEIARSILEGGSLNDTAVAALHGVEVAIPASVHTILAARIDRLPLGRRRILQIAAVIAHHISTPLVAAVSMQTQRDVDGEMSHLCAAGFVHSSELPFGTEYVFKHALIQAEAYESLLIVHRRELHARVLGAMQTLFTDRVDWIAEELAHHALLGENWPEAVRFALNAGARAIRRSAWHRAIASLDQAVESLERLPRNPTTIAQGIEARLQLRVAVVATGDVPGMMVNLEQAKLLAEMAQDTRTVAVIDVRRCMGLSLLGMLDEARRAGDEALVAMRRENDAAGLVAASFALGQTHYIAGDFRAARTVLESKLELVRRTPLSRIPGGPGTPALLFLTCLSRTLCVLGDTDAAWRLADEARSGADQIGRSFDQAEARQAVGMIYHARGQTMQAVTILEEALEIARSNEHWLLVPMIAICLGPAYAASGRENEAVTLLAEGIQRAEHHRLVAISAQCRLALASQWASTKLDESRAASTQLLDLARKHALKAIEASVLRLLGRLSAGEPEAARLFLHDALALATDLGMQAEAAGAAHDLRLLELAMPQK